jgi:hypothetical protein
VRTGPWTKNGDGRSFRATTVLGTSAEPIETPLLFAQTAMTWAKFNTLRWSITKYFGLRAGGQVGQFGGL